MDQTETEFYFGRFVTTAEHHGAESQGLGKHRRPPPVGLRCGRGSRDYQDQQPQLKHSTAGLADPPEINQDSAAAALCNARLQPGCRQTAGSEDVSDRQEE